MTHIAIVDVCQNNFNMIFFCILLSPSPESGEYNQEHILGTFTLFEYFHTVLAYFILLLPYI